MGQQVNIYDVAKAAGVSIATVSRFLNKSTRVSVETREKIQKAIEEMNYVPMGNMSPLSRRHLGRIGVLTPFFPSPSFVERIQGIAETLHGTSYELSVFAVDNKEQLEEYLHSIPLSKRLDGLIIMSLYIDPMNCGRIRQRGLETVFIESAHEGFSSVTADNHRGGALAAAHLLEKNLVPAGFICEELRDSYSFQPARIRQEGFFQAMAQGGYPVKPEHVRYGLYTVDSARELARDLLSRPDRPRSVFTYGDLQAVGVLKAAKDLGLRVPQDVAVIGFDNTETADYLDLSTVSQGLRESGRMAAEILLSRIKDPGRMVSNLQLPVEVVPRSTT